MKGATSLPPDAMTQGLSCLHSRRITGSHMSAYFSTTAFFTVSLISGSDAPLRLPILSKYKDLGTIIEGKVEQACLPYVLCCALLSVSSFPRRMPRVLCLSVLCS